MYGVYLIHSLCVYYAHHHPMYVTVVQVAIESVKIKRKTVKDAQSKKVEEPKQEATTTKDNRKPVAFCCPVVGCDVYKPRLAKLQVKLNF
jgi:hypothetical protein